MTKEKNVKHVCLLQNFIISIITRIKNSIVRKGSKKDRECIRMSRTLHEMVHDNN